MRKFFKRTGCLFLSLCTLCTVACTDEENSSSAPAPEGYELWSAAATEKIMQDVDDSEYAAMKEEPSISIDTAKNEYEGAQVIISADGAVQEYGVTLSDLKSADGENTYAKENIIVYHVKYTNVSSTWSEGARRGWYPDCLLPFDAAVKAGENKVAAGQNQSVYFSFNTPETQATGNYVGEITLTVDGEAHKIPVNLRVRNLTVNEEVHNKSLFLTEWTPYLGEYDGTQEMLDKYNLALLDYRLGGGRLVMDDVAADEDAEYYAEKAYELCATERCSTITVPTNKNADGIPNQNLRRYLTAIANKSLETGCNLVAKCYVYGVDEPISNNALEKTKEFSLDFKAQRLATVEAFTNGKAAYLEAHPDVTEEFYDEIVDSLGGVRYVTTTKYAEEYDGYVDIWCPHFNAFETGLTLGTYDNEDKMWFYGAVSPRAPYPTYHIDDTLLSARVCGWLQSIYNVEGNLFWAVDNYARYTGTYSYLDEFYDSPYHYRFVPGDGFLFYPGKKYGVDGPLPSLRLEAIRDGYEEYELLYNIKAQYESVSEEIGVEFTATDTITRLAAGLYSGMRVLATADSFAAARKSLLDFSEFSQSGVCFTDYSDDGEGLIEYKAYIPDGVTLGVSGVAETHTQAVTGGKIVTYQANMQEATAAGFAKFTTTVNGEQVSVAFALSGRVEKFGADVFLSGISGGVNTEQTLLVDALPITGAEGTLAQITYAVKEGDDIASLTYVDAAMIAKINEGVDRIVFNFYYDGNTDALPVNIWVKYSKTKELNVASTQLTYGDNAIVWENVSKINWKKNGNIEYILFEIGDGNAPAPENLRIYLKNMVMYHVREENV